jgi:hypothetical protein
MRKRFGIVLPAQQTTKASTISRWTRVAEFGLVSDVQKRFLDKIEDLLLMAGFHFYHALHVEFHHIVRLNVMRIAQQHQISESPTVLIGHIRVEAFSTILCRLDVADLPNKAAIFVHNGPAASWKRTQVP